MDSKYIRYEKDITADGYKLMCFHHAGGGASFFAKWQSLMKYGIEVLPVQLTGRENRMREDFIRDCKEIARIVSEELADFLQDKNFSLFGHSMGGILAFETAKYLEKIGKNPDMCFISASDIQEREQFTPSDELSDDDFFERVALYGALDRSSEILQYPEFKQIYLKILRADFGMIEKYTDDGTVIRCPITAMYGKDDPMATADVMSSWAERTSGGFCMREYDGGHFYINENLSGICCDISEIINSQRTEK
ncbi:MAG: alpha/beta fold hydrolase [Ruminococcus flavefaciens]|nr:alpha/beta fold hydrolase [Ruminococcus flavefaciens]